MTSDKIRVLFAIGEMSGGGSERQTLGILKRLDRRAFAPHLYLISPGGSLFPEIPADVPVSIFWQRYRRPRLNWPGRIHRAQVRDLVRVIRDQQIDVVYDRTYHMTMITAAATRRTGTPRASVIVTNPPVDFARGLERFGAIKRRLLCRAYRDAQQVVAVSEGTRRLAAEFYRLPLDKIRTIANFIDVARLADTSDAAQVGFSRDDQRFHLVAAGRLDEAKGYEYLIEAVRQLVHERNRPEIVLHILGIGPLEAALRAAVAEHALRDHVRLVGFQANPFAFYRQAHLLVLSSVYEGMPNVLMEAMATGTPVLSTDCPSGPREILAEGKYGRLVSPADPAALANAIEDALRHYDRWQAVAVDAREYALRTFGPEQGIGRVEELLRELSRVRSGISPST